MAQFDTIDDRSEVDRAFEALKKATPEAYREEFPRMMLMGRFGTVHHFKHSDMRRSFAFDIQSGLFCDTDGTGSITTAEEAYEWARS